MNTGREKLPLELQLSVQHVILIPQPHAEAPVFILYRLWTAETEMAHSQSEAFRDLCGRHSINSLLFGLDLGEHAKKTGSEVFSDVVSISLQLCSMRAIHKPVFLRLQSCQSLSPATAHRAQWDVHPRHLVL